MFCLSNELENTNVDHDVMVDELVLHHINLYYVHVQTHFSIPPICKNVKESG